MFTRAILIQGLALFVCWSISSLSQQKSAASAPVGVVELPVVLQQNVEAGKSQVGTKIQAKLAVATLVNGVVIPQNATLSGLVIESVAKTAADPARLAIRMDSLDWKNGSAPIKAYLTGRYYSKATQIGQSLQYGRRAPGRPDPSVRAVENPSCMALPTSAMPGPSSRAIATTQRRPPSSTTSNRPVLMKNVTLAPTDDGGIALVSQRANVKLDKLTTYVLAASALPAR